jgi:hypothetical protein
VEGRGAATPPRLTVWALLDRGGRQHRGRADDESLLRDHNRDVHLHFHARHADGGAKVRIDQVEVITAASMCTNCGSCSHGRSTAASAARHRVLRVTFADGLAGEVDVLNRIQGPAFEQARTPSGFAKVTVDPESGTVMWSGGADLAPDTLYLRVSTGLWPDENVGA